MLSLIVVLSPLVSFFNFLLASLKTSHYIILYIYLVLIFNTKVANDGTIPFRDGNYNERVFLSYYFTQKFSSDSVKLQILRDGELKEVFCPLYISRPLIPRLLLQV